MNYILPERKDNPKLMQKKLSDGRFSLYLEYYLGYTKDFDKETGKWKIKHKRKKEFLGKYLINKPHTIDERNANKETLDFAYEVRKNKENELTSKKHNIPEKNKAKINFVDYCQKFENEYVNKDIRIVKYCIKYFNEFVIKETGKAYILPVDITEKFALKFKNYLESKLNGETPYNYFTKFKKICKESFKDGLPIDHNILDIRNTRNEGLKKDILSIEEIKKLANTDFSNKEVKRAFLFSLNTGLRFCDVNNLIWQNVNKEQIIIKSQQKTGKPVYIDLNNNAKNLLGTNGKMDEKVFNLPSLTGCLKLLKAWASKAKIEKNITWHSARHSFAVNLLIYKTDIKTVSSLLGHAGLRHTEKYTRVIDELKKNAVNNLPDIDL